MVNRYLSNKFELVKYLFKLKPKTQIFDPAAKEFVKLINLYYILADSIDKVSNLLDRKDYRSEFGAIKNSFNTNSLKIIEMLEAVTNRKITVHILQDKDTIWKLLKKYDSNINEIIEINSIQNIFSMDEKKIIIIPNNY